MTKFTWNDENTARLVELAGPEGSFVSQDQLVQFSEELGTTNRSVGSKLRKMNYDVELAGTKKSAWTAEEEAELRAMVEGNPGAYTYAELAAAFKNGKYSAKTVQGKILSMELYEHIRKAEKRAPVRTYTPEEEAQFVAMVADGASVETLADHFGRPVASIRGKALSLLKAGEISEMPKQETSKAREVEDFFAGIDLENTTVEQLVELSGNTKSARGIKATLSRRGLKCADYDGAARRAKLDAAKED
jgi:transposase-like protein